MLSKHHDHRNLSNAAHNTDNDMSKTQFAIAATSKRNLITPKRKVKAQAFAGYDFYNKLRLEGGKSDEEIGNMAQRKLNPLQGYGTNPNNRDCVFWTAVLVCSSISWNEKELENLLQIKRGESIQHGDRDDKYQRSLDLEWYSERKFQLLRRIVFTAHKAGVRSRNFTR